MYLNFLLSIFKEQFFVKEVPLVKLYLHGKSISLPPWPILLTLKMWIPKLPILIKILGALIRLAIEMGHSFNSNIGKILV